MALLRRGWVQVKKGFGCLEHSRQFGASSGRRNHEYFVRIWNTDGVNSPPSRIRHCLSTLDISFEGSMLQPGSTDEEKIIGTSFACRSASPDAIKEALKTHPYYTNMTWNFDQVEITALETVHSGDFEQEAASPKL